MVAKEAEKGIIFMADGIDSPEIRGVAEPRLIDTVMSDIQTIGELTGHNRGLSKKLFEEVKGNVGIVQENPEVVTAITSSLDRLVGQVKTRPQSEGGLLADWYECNDLIDTLYVLGSSQPDRNPLQESTTNLAQQKLADIALTYEQVPNRGETLPEQAAKNFRRIAISPETIEYLTESGMKAWKLAIDTIDLHREVVKRLNKTEDGSVNFSIEPAYETLLTTIFSTQNNIQETPELHALRVKTADQFSTVLQDAPNVFSKEIIQTIKTYLDENVKLACKALGPDTQEFRDTVNKFIVGNQDRIYSGVMPSKPDLKPTDIPQPSVVESSIQRLAVSTPEGLEILGHKEATILRTIEDTLELYDPSIKPSDSVTDYFGDGPEKPGVLDVIRQQSKAESVKPIIQALQADRERLVERDRQKTLAEERIKFDARKKDEKKGEEARRETLTFQQVMDMLGNPGLNNLSASEADELAAATKRLADQLREYKI